MITPEPLDAKPSRKFGISHSATFALGSVVFLVAVPLIHGVVPWAISFGWALLYGSVPVSVGLLIVGTGMGALAPQEERALEARFGEKYRQYKAEVPRWLFAIWR